VGRLPIGTVVAGRFVDSPEGTFLGAFTLGTDGEQAPLPMPSTSQGFSGAWSLKGGFVLATMFNGQRLVTGTIDRVTGAFAEIRADGLAGELDCTDWNPVLGDVICTLGGADPADDGIYAVTVATGDATRLTTSAFHHVVGTAGECGGGEGRAVYAPDGLRFAYVQQKCGTGANPSEEETGAIAVAAADGSGSKVIVPFGGVRTHPGGEISWSPKNDLIAFGTQDGKLSVVRPDGSGLRQLQTPGFAYGPEWSPDGTWLLVTVVATKPSEADLFAVAADGSATVQLTNTPEVEAYTDWATVR
jgi:Anaphase-promoting complex subunit 4 WD40 domain